jgi:hypothetical protein
MHDHSPGNSGVNARIAISMRQENCRNTHRESQSMTPSLFVVSANRVDHPDPVTPTVVAVPAQSLPSQRYYRRCAHREYRLLHFRAPDLRLRPLAARQLAAVRSEPCLNDPFTWASRSRRSRSRAARRVGAADRASQSHADGRAHLRAFSDLKRQISRVVEVLRRDLVHLRSGAMPA